MKRSLELIAYLTLGAGVSGLAVAQNLDDIVPADADQADSIAVEEGAVPRSAIEEIVVTGSRLKRDDLTSISPISVLSADDMKVSGNITLEDFLQDLPSTLGGADYGSTVNNGNPGLATVQLRGLGPNRTLVLLNGRRPAQAGTDGIVDLNTIPTAMIERIEVLRDGASTVYGSDAIAGVINIITKKNFTGLQAELGYDVTAHGDGEQTNMSMTWGNSFDGGHVVISGQYTKRKPIFQRDRSFSACPLQEDAMGAIVCGGSGTTTPAQIIPTNEPPDAGTFIVDEGTDEVRPFDGAGDAYNYAAASYMVTPQDVYSLYASSEYTILPDSPWGSLNSFLESSFTNRESDQLLASVGTFWAPSVPASNPFNPFGTDQCAGNPHCTGGPQSVNIARRLEETNGRPALQDAEAWRFVMGLDGDLPNDWSWELSYNVADWTDAQRDGGRAVQPRITGLVDPNCEDNSICDPLPSTVEAWDPFRRGTMTPEQIAYGTVAVNNIDRSRMRVLQFNLSGDLMQTFSLPGGEPSWALGFERRSESAESLPDGGSAIGAVYFTPGNITKGAYDVDEVYGEISLPIMSDFEFPGALTLEASFRTSDYDFVPGSDTNFKYALDWAPINDLRLRVTMADGFRAPNLSERFLGQQRTAASYSDPCNNWDTSGSQTIQDNCGPNGDNLPPGFVANAPQATTLEGGTPDLDPETSESLTYGLVFTPEALPGLSITVDFYDIEIQGAIGTAGTGNVINRCYNSAGFSDPLCALIGGPDAVGEGPSAVAPDRRNSQNQVTGIFLTNQNLSSFETSGVDFQIKYGFDTQAGEVDVSLVGSYMDRYNYLPVIGGTQEQLAGKFGIDPYNKNAVTAFPELAINLITGLRTDNWGATLTTRWFDETLDGFDGAACGSSCVADDAFYFDVQGYYEYRNIVLTAGIRNLTDETPPYVTNYDDMNTLHYTYDTAGAYYYSRISLEF